MEICDDRVVLREFQIDDWEAIHRVTSRPEVCRYQPWGPSSPEETRAYVQAVLQTREVAPRMEYTLTAVLREPGEPVGYGSLWLRNHEFRCGEIGFFLRPESWGQGLGTEIAALLLECAFEHFQLHRVYATCDPRNAGLDRVLRKIGMSYEGHLRHTMLIRDGWRDSYVFGMLENEWDQGDELVSEAKISDW